MRTKAQSYRRFKTIYTPNDITVLQLEVAAVYYQKSIKGSDTMSYTCMNRKTIRIPRRSFELHT